MARNLTAICCLPQLGIALEELGLEYDAHRVDISKGDQFKPEFIVVNPNSKIPAITDPNGPGWCISFFSKLTIT